jgi:hypothetical protein
MYANALEIISAQQHPQLHMIIASPSCKNNSGIPHLTAIAKIILEYLI